MCKTIEPDEALKAWRTQLEFQPSREYKEAMVVGLAALSKAHRAVDHEAYMAMMNNRFIGYNTHNGKWIGSFHG